MGPVAAFVPGRSRARLLALPEMGSLSFSEILTILVVILIVFGPKRLPEVARRAGQLVAKVREATSALSSQLEAELGDTMDPIKELKGDYDGVKKDLSDVVTTISGTRSPKRQPDADAPPSPVDEEPTTDEHDDAEPSETVTPLARTANPEPPGATVEEIEAPGDDAVVDEDGDAGSASPGEVA